MIALVVAVSRNGVIGKGGKMPWHLPADLFRFRKRTKGHVVVMGRKTYESIGGPLPDRTNVVLTRDTHFKAEGCEVVHSIEALLHDDRMIFVIGGAEIYRQFLPYADVLHLTRIDAELEGDTFFPEWHDPTWTLVSSVERARDEKNPYNLVFETYERSR